MGMREDQRFKIGRHVLLSPVVHDLAPAPVVVGELGLPLLPHALPLGLGIPLAVPATVVAFLAAGGGEEPAEREISVGRKGEENKWSLWRKTPQFQTQLTLMVELWHSKEPTETERVISLVLPPFSSTPFSYPPFPIKSPPIHLPTGVCSDSLKPLCDVALLTLKPSQCGHVTVPAPLQCVHLYTKSWG